MRTYKLIFLFLFIGLNHLELTAQDLSEGAHNLGINIPELAILDIEGNTAIGINPVAPDEAGLSLDFSNANENSLWLNYSSIVGSETGTKRNITARISSGTVPGGTILKLRAGNYQGNGGGELGNNTPKITLTEEDQNIITGIGSCYTGDGPHNGHRLKYFLLLDDDHYEDLSFDDSNILQIQFTISNN